METNDFERIAFSGFWRRVCANVVDGILLGIVGIVIAIPLFIGMFSLASNAAMVGDQEALTAAIARMERWGYIVAAANIFVYLAYMIGFKYRRGATPGYSRLGIKIVSMTGDPLTIAQVVVRFIGSLCSLLALGLGFLWIAFDKHRQSWHDKAAGTYVVYAEATPTRRTVTTQSHWMRPAIFASIIGAAVVVQASLFTSGVMIAKSTDAYQEAAKFIINRPEYIELVGTPISLDWMPTVQIEYSEGKGEALIVTDISGSQGSTTAMVKLQKRGEEWIVVAAGYQEEPHRFQELNIALSSQ
jgi:uncharacterized RDD family membrane protein YckC